MNRYLEVFFAHKLALVGLIAIALVMSTIVVMAMPRTYEVTASLWFDQGPIPDSSASNANLTPADQGTAVLHELINTRDFDVKVGRRGPLASYFDSTGNFPNSDPVTAMVHRLEGKPAPTGDARAALVDNGVLYTLQKYVLIVPSEPHVVTLTFNFADPSVAAGTLTALLDQFEEQVKATTLLTAQGSVDFFEAQVTDELKVVQAADAALAQYLAAHPEQRLPDSPFDPTYANLKQADDLARNDLAALTQKLEQAKLTVASLQQPGPYGFRVIDLPEAPSSATGLLKSVLLGVAGGIGVGLLLVGVICFLLVAADDTVLRGSELTRRLGVQVVGEIPAVSADARAAAARRPTGPRKVT